jgi:type I restriction enzyme R subunit
MNEDNFLVRPHLELIGRFRDVKAWDSVSVGDLAELADRVASLPDQLDPEHPDAKRFDVLLLNTELGLLKGEPFERERKRIVELASMLDDMQNIPAVRENLGLIQELQIDEWWVNVSFPMLEEVRKRLRLLVQLIEYSRKNALYSNFTDSVGRSTEIELPGTGGSIGSREFELFRKRAEFCLKEHLQDPVVEKVRSGDALSATDIADLQQILSNAGVGDASAYEAAGQKSGSFGLFVRSLVGLDRAAAKRAFADFLDETRYSKNQIEFVNMIVDELTSQGLVEPKRLYEAPYDGLSAEGPNAMFVESDVVRIVDVIQKLRDAAA